MKTLLRASRILTLDDAGTTYQPGCLLLENDRIIDLGPEEQFDRITADLDVNLGNRLIMPGLINTHTHTPMVLFRGLAEGHSLLTWEGWYNTIRVWEEVMDPDMVPPAVLVSCAEMIRTGTTCFADQYFSMNRVLPAVRQSGLRAALAYGIVEMGDPESRRREINAASEFLESVRGDPRIKGWVGPHALFVDNSPQAIELELELADQFETGLHIHLGTSGEEEAFCREHFGRSAIEQMDVLGVLDRPLIAAHCITVPEADFGTLAASEFTAVIAASACMRAGAASAPLKSMQAAGINTALGTDNVTNNNSYDLFLEMRTAAKLMSLREGEPGAIPALSILKMATMGGARALGLQHEVGSLEPGKKADLISLDLSSIGWTPMRGQDTYTALVYAVGGMHVQDVMVDGSWLLRDGNWTTIDYPMACSDLDLAFAELQTRRSD
jgi:5-methylthioadenosine/S-adenosylhomocysteine deaminase